MRGRAIKLAHSKARLPYAREKNASGIGAPKTQLLSAIILLITLAVKSLEQFTMTSGSSRIAADRQSMNLHNFAGHSGWRHARYDDPGFLPEPANQ